MTVMQQGLLIAGIGMGLVFVVIIFLWGLMALMMRLTSGKQSAEQEEALPKATDTPLLPELGVVEGQRKAAAVAVAVAVAQAGSRQPMSVRLPSEEDAGGLNPWLAVHRARQIEQKNSRG